MVYKSLVGLSLGENVWVTGFDDGQSWASMIFTTGSSECDVISSIENDFSLGNGCVIFELSFSDGWAVVAEDDEFGFSWSEGSEGGFIPEDVLSGFHNQREFAVNVFGGVFLDHLMRVWVDDKYYKRI